MKLRNKKTGKIGYLYEYSLMQDIIIVYDVKGIVGKYASIAELDEEWEDYEEPKKHYFITQFGDVVDEVDGYMSETIDEMKQIGNYFNTREEAEKAVEKLKAWKRLKDKGFKFDNFGRNAAYFNLSEEHIQDMNVINDLECVFGGEE